MSDRVAVAILTWQAEAVTRTCLSTLRGDAGWRGPTVVVDNGSGSGEGERLAREFGIARVELPENGGVPAGYNAAIRWAMEQGATHVLLANNDLEFADGALVDRLAALAAGGVAAVGPVIRTQDGAIWSAGGKLLRWFGHVRRTHSTWADAPYEVDALDGACLLVSVEAACRIGGLAPEFFLYWEETDWCARARAAGYRLLVDPASSVGHFGSRSVATRQRRAYALRNSLLFVRRNLRGPALITASIAWVLGRAPLFVLRRTMERAGPSSILEDLAWAFRFHLGDARAHGWRRAAAGPEVCG